MNYAQAGQATQPSAPREQTINERLNRVSDRMQAACERIEGVLARVNGTPQAEKGDPSKLAQINPTLPLGTVVEHFESIQARLIELANGVERIA